MKNYQIHLEDLDRAVIAQLGGTCEDTAQGCAIDDDTAGTLADVCRCPCGAAGGFNGFTYYTETREFTAANRELILARLREQIAEGLFEGARSAVGAVTMFSCFKGEDPAQIEEEAARVLFGDVAAIRSGDLDTVANALAWGVLEDLAFRLDGQEIEGDEADGSEANG